MKEKIHSVVKYVVKTFIISQNWLNTWEKETIQMWYLWLQIFLKESHECTCCISSWRKKQTFNCDICDYSCSQKNDMKVHVASVHEGKKSAIMSFDGPKKLMSFDGRRFSPFKISVFWWIKSHLNVIFVTSAVLNIQTLIDMLHSFMKEKSHSSVTLVTPVTTAVLKRVTWTNILHQFMKEKSKETLAMQMDSFFESASLTIIHKYLEWWLKNLLVRCFWNICIRSQAYRHNEYSKEIIIS